MKILLLLLPFAWFQSLVDFNKLVGTWKMNTPQGPLFETWKSNSDGSLSGMSYMLKGKDSTVFERTTISADGGDVYYSAKVADQNNGKAVRFKLVSSIGGYRIFENKDHDFPQRVIYEFVTADSIHARIEGTDKGTRKAEDFYYRRVK